MSQQTRILTNCGLSVAHLRTAMFLTSPLASFMSSKICCTSLDSLSGSIWPSNSLRESAMRSFKAMNLEENREY